MGNGRSLVMPVKEASVVQNISISDRVSPNEVSYGIQLIHLSPL